LKVNRGIVIAFLAGGIVSFGGVLGAIQLGWYPFVSSPIELRTESHMTYPGLKVGSASLKIMSLLPGQDRVTQKQLRLVSCKFELTNLLDSSIRYHTKFTLLDRDGFVLGEKSIDSNAVAGNLGVRGSRTVFVEFSLPASAAKSATMAKIDAMALKTDTQIAEENVEAEANRLRQQVAFDRARNEEIAAIRAHWGALQQGMSKRQVEELLGRPRSIDSDYFGDTWFYAKTGSFARAKAVFSKEGALKSWESP